MKKENSLAKYRLNVLDVLEKFEGIRKNNARFIFGILLLIIIISIIYEIIF
jgi:hypothetical protein